MSASCNDLENRNYSVPWLGLVISAAVCLVESGNARENPTINRSIRYAIGPQTPLSHYCVQVLQRTFVGDRTPPRLLHSVDVAAAVVSEKEDGYRRRESAEPLLLLCTPPSEVPNPRTRAWGRSTAHP